MKLLWAIIEWILDLFVVPKPKPVLGLPSLPTDPVSGALDVAAVAGELGITAIQVLDSPEMIAGRYAVSLQKVKDAIQLHNQQAMATGKGDDVNRDLTP